MAAHARSLEFRGEIVENDGVDSLGPILNGFGGE
jgi:hypothetical protein